MPRAQASRLAILIPAYRPSDSLLEVVRSLAEKSFPNIVVVDDGSGAEYGDLFARVAALPGVELLRHATNLGKGAALKTGLNFALCRYENVAGVVTADADGQHHPDDIERVAESLLAHPDSLVLGCRTFRGEVPLRSRIGNAATSTIMHALMGRKMADTQTGLRGIPADLATRILKLEANGYEFELEMLLTAHQLGIALVEEPIRTIYLPGNPSSHFNPIVDSMKIYFILLRFGGVSLLTALLDNLVFILARHQGATVLTAQILGRTVGLIFNYSMVRGSVFYSHQRHKTVLPKYLALVVASGSVSYGGIRFMAARFGMDAVPAKLMVETLLFFLNFAVQRLFIFTPGVRAEEAKATRRPLPEGRFSKLVAAIFAGALAVEAYGFTTAQLFSQDIWEPIGHKRFVKYIGIFLGVAVPLLMMAPWSFPTLMAALTVVGTGLAIGPLALAAVAFYLISSCALGSRLLGRKHGDTLESQLFSTLLGIGAWIFLMTLVARIPVNYPAAWASVLAIPILLDGRGVLRRLGSCWRALLSLELRRPAERAAFAVMVFVLLAHWFVALMPEVSADGLAMHLAIPANIALHHEMTFQPDRFVWSVMPMGADFSYSIVYLLGGGEYAAHLLDYALLLALVALLYCVLRRWVCQAAAFWLLALFASTPLVQLVTGSLFVENLLAAMVMGMMAALWRFADAGERRYLYLAAALGGTAMATKFGALAFVALAIPFLAIEAGRHWKALGPRPAAACLLAFVLLLGLAAPPYAIAYAKTRNPLFPFLYDKIPSPLIPPTAGLIDERFKRPLTWKTLYDLTFRTHLTYEGQNGSFGFQYLAFVPLAVAALLLVERRRGVGSAAVVAIGAAAIVMATQPNARYVYAALPLFSVPFAALLERASGTRWLYRCLMVFVLACIVINLRFLPSGSWYHRDWALRLPFSHAERDRYRATAAPIREVIAYFNRAHAGEPVLLTDDSAIAGLNADIYENHWHQINHFWRIRDVKSLPEMIALMQSWRIRYFISPKPAMGEEIKPALLRAMLERCTEVEFEQGDQYLARLEPTCRPAPERTALLVQPGFYDDFDPALLYHGDWNHDRNFADPDRHTISFTNVTGDQVEIDFNGAALTYTYTKADNRGIASLTVDGVEQGPIDLYSDKVEWRTQQRFCCFPRGRHVAVLRVTGKSDPRSKSTFVDLDSFTVE